MQTWYLHDQPLPPIRELAIILPPPISQVQVAPVDGPTTRAAWVRATSAAFEGCSAAACMSTIDAALQAAGKAGVWAMMILTQDAQFDPLTATKCTNLE